MEKPLPRKVVGQIEVMAIQPRIAEVHANGRGEDAIWNAPRMGRKTLSGALATLLIQSGHQEFNHPGLGV